MWLRASANDISASLLTTKHTLLLCDKQIGKCFKETPLLIVLELLEVPRGPNGKSAGPELTDFLMCRQVKPDSLAHSSHRLTHIYMRCSATHRLFLF